MSSRTRSPWRISATVLVLLLLVNGVVLGLNSDGVLLLSFKYAILSDPSSVLQNWIYSDESPCGWKGVICEEISSELRVVALVLPSSQLLGSISLELGCIENLRRLDLCNNFFNGTIPNSLFNATQLQNLSLCNNKLSGELPESFGNLQQLQYLNFSDNALTGEIPVNLTLVPQLRFISLSNNYFYGEIPSGFSSDSRPLQVLDLSSNLLNGSLPTEIGNLYYLNLSYNRLTGEIPSDFASKLPENATIDLSYNNLTGAVPETGAFLNQKPESFAGNPELCGGPLKNPCVITSTVSNPPNISTSPPAIAAIPLFNSNPAITINGTNQQQQQQQQTHGGLRPGKIAAIVVADFTGLSLLCMFFVYRYQAKKKKIGNIEKNRTHEPKRETSSWNWSANAFAVKLFCLGKRDRDDETSETTTTGSDTEEEQHQNQHKNHEQRQQQGSLVTLDGESELELERLLKASAYILGATGSSIVYKAVLENGTTFAVRRIGETGVERFKDFENQARLVARLRHPNLVRLCGFYWGTDEKLLIYDYVPNGNLANACYRKLNSSPFNLPWEARLRIARGVARGLVFLHEKKHVHGNLKPSNILLGPEMEPRIGDFGLEKLISGDNSNKTSSSARHFGSKRSTLSRESVQDLPVGTSPGGSTSSVSSYQAPEAMKNLKPNYKSDVYSFGIVLLEMLTGKIPTEKEISHWNAGFTVEEKNRVLRMVDPCLRAELEERADALVSCFKLGFGCASLIPQKRPSMKEALQILDRIPSSPSPLIISPSNYHH